MVRFDELFDVWYGVNLEVVNCEVTDATTGVPFVSRQSVDEGVVCYIKRIDNTPPNPANTLSIACSGSVLSTYYHDYEYYSGRDVYIARPKRPMSQQMMIFYASILELNKYRYNYGRAANRTLKGILIPSYEDVKTKLLDHDLLINPFNEVPILKKKNRLTVSTWKWFRYDEIFVIKKGFYNKKPDSIEGGDIPFIGATDSNNGITSFTTIDVIENTSKTGDNNNVSIDEKIFAPNCLTVSNNGSVGFAFYQDERFTCSHDVNPLYLKKRKMNIYIALFLATLIEKERYRWTYGRKWRPKRMPDSLIKLPVTKDNIPDWKYMEDYIKSLPYSGNL